MNGNNELQNNRVMYIGNFGSKNSINGSQVKKTLSIYNYLIANGISVIKINSEKFKTLFFPLVFVRFIFILIVSDKVIVSLNKNGLKFGKYLLLRIITGFKKERLIFITIGGWLPEFIAENQETIKYFKSFHKIYVQADEIKYNLKKLGLINGENMLNFRDYDSTLLKVFEERIKIIDYTQKRELKLVFFAFIGKEKGLDIIIDAIKEFNIKQGENIYHLDIIGPIEKKYQIEFDGLTKGNSDICSYKGIITNQKEIYETLNRYDLMAFPTYYEGEGFPTVIVESFISGLPVIASDWKYNSEIIIDNYNGRLFKTKSVEDLTKILEQIYFHKQELKEMRLNCLKEAKKFHPDLILNPILNGLRD